MRNSIFICLLTLVMLSGCATTGGHIPGSPDSANGNGYQPADHPAVHTTPEDKYSAGSLKERNGVSNQDLLDSALDLSKSSREYWSEDKIDDAIEALDQAYTLVLKVDTDRYPDLIQQKDDLRFVISKRILEIYASRYTAVNGKHDAIPLTMNKHVEAEIKLFQTSERKFFMDSYRRSGKYMPAIVDALKEAGMPEELAWLPLIESGFKVRALSRARALGLWQFIPSTGYKFGLKRDTWVDERMDPEKATAAAIEYMTELHHMFGEWITVLAAYNCGEGRVLRVIREQKINYLDNFWDLYERLPRETARYVPRFLAVLHIMKDPEKYGFSFDAVDDPISYETVKINKSVQLKAVAYKLNISHEDLFALNPELRQKVTPGKEYQLKVPLGKGDILLAIIDEIPTWTPPQKTYAYHKVRKGDTLSGIAGRYKASVNDIVRTNKIRKKHMIRIGQKLKIPLKGAGRYASNKTLMPGGKYRIKKGDSLSVIARRFNTNTKSIQSLNKMRSTMLYVGQVIKIPN